MVVIPIISQWELYIAMSTRVPTKPAQIPNAAFPLPDDGLHEMWSELANWIKVIQ